MRKVASEIRELWQSTTKYLPFDRHMGFEGIARAEAILAVKDFWRKMEEVETVRQSDVIISRLMEIRTILEAMYYTREPDRGYVDDLIKEANHIGGQNARHLKQIEMIAKKVLSLRNSPWSPKSYQGFSESDEIDFSSPEKQLGLFSSNQGFHFSYQ